MHTLILLFTGAIIGVVATGIAIYLHFLRTWRTWP